MSADKLLLVYAMLIKLESSYNGGGTLSAATDGIELVEPVEASLGYLHDGDRGNAPGSAGTRKRNRPSGRSAELAPKIEARGTGSAYSASNLPPGNAALRAAGLGVTVVTTAGSETATYAPVSDKASMASAFAECYSRGQKWPMTGVYCDFTLTVDGPSEPILEFPSLQGLVAIPTDTSPPAVTYPTVMPPKAENVALAIGAWATPVVRKFAFKQNRKVSPRADINSAGHRGFSPGRRAPTLEITVEACALSTFDPYTARDQATPLNVTALIGAVQYNKLRVTAAQAQITEIAEDSDEETALWTLTLACPPSTPAANDDFALQYL